MDFLSLPVVMIEHVFSYLSYDEIAKHRLMNNIKLVNGERCSFYDIDHAYVCKAFNEICMKMLNRGFIMIERRHALALKNVKGKLPRRESERRYHPLSRHCDILTSIETRISMLNMTYLKFIDHGLCCFIPGKVIDEIKRVLCVVETCKTPQRAHEVLQELRDISSMAIEHFDDKISPAFRKRLQEGEAPPAPRANGMLSSLALKQEVLSLRRRSVLHAKLSLYLAGQYKRFYKRMTTFRKIALQQRKTIKELTNKQRYQDAAIADLKKRIEECDIKYNELTHTNQAAGGKAIAAAAAAAPEPSPAPAQPLRHFGSQIKLDLSVLPIGTGKRTHAKMLPNIKPRNPVIALPSLTEDDNSEPPPKMQKTTDRPPPAPPAAAPAPPAAPPAAAPPAPPPAPSTSASSRGESPRSKTQSTMAKIRGLTDEIRHLSNLSTNIEGSLKRPAPVTWLALEELGLKKPKTD